MVYITSDVVWEGALFEIEISNGEKVVTHFINMYLINKNHVGARLRKIGFPNNCEALLC